MAARGNMILKDRAPTPSSHTYTPDGRDANGVHVWSEKTSVPAGNPRVTATLTESKGKYRPKLKLYVPVVATQTINGVSSPVILRKSFVEVQFNFDSLSTEQERKDVVGLLTDMIAPGNTQLNDLITGLTDIW